MRSLFGEEIDGPKKVLNMDIHGMVELTASLPSNESSNGDLTRQLNAFAKELAEHPGAEKTTEILEQLSQIGEISSTVAALRELVTGKSDLVLKLVNEILTLWNRHTITQDGKQAILPNPMNEGRIKQIRSTDEQLAWDLINQADGPRVYKAR